jgi:recombination protein RecT
MTTQALREVATGERKRPTDFPGMLEAYKGEIARALPKHLNADTMTRIALTSFRLTPKLAECAPQSVFACVIQASQLGLRPGLLGECFLIPFKKKNSYICQLIVGYQGMIELARRSGQVLSIGAYVVHEKDQYAVKFGTDPGIEHIPFLHDDPGAPKLAYAVAELKGGGKHAEVMSIREINSHRDRSSNYRAAKTGRWDTPWDTDYEEMARKTVIRRICKYLPKSNELALGLSLDYAADRGTQLLTVEDAISGAFVPDPVEGEATEKPAELEKPSEAEAKPA